MLVDHWGRYEKVDEQEHFRWGKMTLELEQVKPMLLVETEQKVVHRFEAGRGLRTTNESQWGSNERANWAMRP